MVKYRAYVSIDGNKPKWVIKDDGKVVNENPSRDELEYLEIEEYKNNRNEKYTDKELLCYLKQFYDKNGLIPMQKDFVNNPEYPSFTVYYKRFFGWNKALFLAGLNTYERKKQEKYTDEELLDYLRQFYNKNNRAPMARDFANNTEYPSYATYQKRFGGWNKSLKLAGLDIDKIVRQGILQNEYHKGRLAEILVKEHFKKNPKDLSGHSRNSPCDGICPNGKTYDVKSSKLYNEAYWDFSTKNKYKEEIEVYYFVAFNKDWMKLEYIWRIPGEIVEKDHFRVGIYRGEFNIENLKDYDITDKFNLEKDVEQNWKIKGDNT